MENYQLIGDSPTDRLVRHLGRYTSSTVYGVVRTDVWKDAISSYLLSSLPRNLGFELFLEGNIALLGKSLVIPELVWMRSSENPTHQLVEGESNQDFKSWWQIDDRRQVVETGVYQMCGQLTQDNSCREEWFSAWMKSLNLFASRPRVRQKKRFGILKTLKNLFSKSVRLSLEPFLGFAYRRHLGWRPIQISVAVLTKSGVSINVDELNDILKRISSRWDTKYVDEQNSQ